MESNTGPVALLQCRLLEIRQRGPRYSSGSVGVLHFFQRHRTFAATTRSRWSLEIAIFSCLNHFETLPGSVKFQAHLVALASLWEPAR